MVDHVHPDHRRPALVAVVMPVVGRRQDEIARLHGELLALDGRIGARALQDHADRGGYVLVVGRALAGPDQLQAEEDRGQRRQTIGIEAGIDQREDATLGLLDRHEIAGAQQFLAQSGVGPMKGDRLLDRGADRHDRAQQRPGRQYVEVGEAGAIIGRQLRRRA